MFSRKMYGEMRRAGFKVGVSKEKLAAAMLEILLAIPAGTKNLKETIVANLGLIGQQTSVRDISAVWNQTKKKAAKLYPEKFILDGRNNLLWNDGSAEVLDKKISPANFKKLNELAETEGCSVNAMVSKLINWLSTWLNLIPYVVIGYRIYFW